MLAVLFYSSGYASRRANGRCCDVDRALRSVRDPRRQVEDGGDLPRVMVDVEIRVKDKSVRHRINGCSDRHGHHPWVEVATESPFGLEEGEQLFEEVNRNVDIPAVEAPLPGGRQTAVSYDFDDGHHVVPVLTHEREVRLDVGAERRGSSRFGTDARDYVGPSGFDDLDGNLPDEVVFAGEVV